jgi:ribosomal protein L17
MKNKLADLNNHLFAQLERLSEEGISAEQIETECKRADAIVSVADQITRGAELQLKAVKILADHGDRFKPQLTMIGGNSAE